VSLAASHQQDGQTGRQLLVFSPDQTRAFELPPSGEVTIGRGEDNIIRIEHASVSRRHALLHVRSEIAIEDLGAANGTFVQDRMIDAEQTVALKQLVRQSAEIAIGQTVMLGAVTLVVRRAPESVTSFPDLARPGAPAGVVVRDPQMRAAYAQAERAAAASITVLILGETGVGKEVLARAIHARSPRNQGPFLGVNCAAFSESLLEGELFGHEKGAFTGAMQARPGLFEAANGGTLFLDEIGEVAPATQVKLLRVLEERAVLRIGARAARPINVRYIAATNRDLEVEVAAGRFRQDLFFRLNGINLTIPPLRERPSDIEPLVRLFLAAACREMDRPEPMSVSDQAMSLLVGHDWPGNVRELRNAIERAVVLCTGMAIRPEHLPASLSARRSPGSAPPPSRELVQPGAPTPVPDVGLEHFRDHMKSLERLRVVEALNRCGGNQTRAAEMLGISRRTLVSRLRELKLPRPRKPEPG
jgi:DNA-binding NtrC family response regulator